MGISVAFGASFGGVAQAKRETANTATTLLAANSGHRTARVFISRLLYRTNLGINPDFPLENFQGLKTGTNLTGKSKFFDWFHMPSNHSR
jgi:hypothetical protein